MVPSSGAPPTSRLESNEVHFHFKVLTTVFILILQHISEVKKYFSLCQIESAATHLSEFFRSDELVEN